MDEVFALINENFAAFTGIAGTLAGSVIGVVSSRAGAKTDEHRRYVLAHAAEQKAMLELIQVAADEQHEMTKAARAKHTVVLVRSNVSGARPPRIVLDELAAEASSWRIAKLKLHWVEEQAVADAAERFEYARRAVRKAARDNTRMKFTAAMCRLDDAFSELSSEIGAANIKSKIEVAAVLKTGVSKLKNKLALKKQLDSVNRNLMVFQDSRAKNEAEK